MQNFDTAPDVLMENSRGRNKPFSYALQVYLVYTKVCEILVKTVIKTAKL